MNAEATETTEATSSVTENVTMPDGRVVPFVGVKRQMLKDSIISDDGSITVRFDFRNGTSLSYQPTPDLISRLAAHGAEQKIGDAAAGEKDIDDMILAVEQAIDRLNKGEWRVTREGGGMSGTSVLLRAMVELANGKKTVEQVKEWLKTKTQKDKAALRASEKLKPIVDRLEAEKASKGTKVDTASLLDDFEAA
jgi:hypothetical protein